jgi:hypothetical protein
MTTFLTFIGVIALFLIAKFIYDTYLTNNTEKSWHDYKLNNPHEAQVLENNKGLNFKTNYSVRKDGFYSLRMEGINQYGNPYKFTVFLIFNMNGFVSKFEFDGFPEVTKEAMLGVLAEVENYNENNKESAKIDLHDGKISFKFNSPSSNHEEYVGSVIKDGLILDRVLHYFDQNLGRMNTKTSLKDLKFIFISI